MGYIFVMIFFLLLLIGVPIAFTISGISSANLLMEGYSIETIAQWMLAGIDSFPLVAIPLFIITGELMSRGGLTSKLIDFANSIVGHLPGGLAVVSILTCMLFGAITGSAVAAAAAVGGVMIPVMKKEGYDSLFTVPLIAAGSILGPVIPPSIALLLYGNSAGVSIADMFIAGVVPGILLGLALMITSMIIGKRLNYQGREKMAPLTEMLSKGRHAVLALLTPVLIVGGIMSGIFTATESAAAAVVYAAIVGFFIYRELDLFSLWNILKGSAILTGQILIIVSAVALLTRLLTIQQIPQEISSFMLEYADNAIIFLIIVNIIFLISGAFIDTVSAVVLFTPIFLPSLAQFGIDPVHFGVIMTVNLSIGMLTPPLGMSLFVTSTIAKVSVKNVIFSKYLWIFIGVLLTVQVLITFIPSISLFLVELMNEN